MKTKKENVMCSECEYFRSGDPKEGDYDHCVNDAWFNKNKGEWFHIVDRNFGACPYGKKKEEN